MTFSLTRDQVDAIGAGLNAAVDTAQFIRRHLPPAIACQVTDRNITADIVAAIRGEFVAAGCAESEVGGWINSILAAARRLRHLEGAPAGAA